MAMLANTTQSNVSGEKLQSEEVLLSTVGSQPVSQTSQLTIISYNLHGLNQGMPGLNDLISKLSPDVIMVQEHWLTPDNLYKLSNISNDYFVYGSSAMGDCVKRGPLVGRPFG